MQNKKQQKQSNNITDKIGNAATTVPDENQIQNHNSKKVSLGPNTKR